MKKVLVITYYWPPSGGSGVQRWLKQSKYLRDYGWEPVIYTAEGGEMPAVDHSLEDEVVEGTAVIKQPIWEPYSVYKKFVGQKKEEGVGAGFISESKKIGWTQKMAVWIRGNFFIPDARKFWIKPSVKFLNKYLQDNPVDAIISTGPPHSMHMIALGVHKKLGIPWIADFRDPWTTIDFYDQLQLSARADKKHHRLERAVLQNASRVVCVSWSWGKDLERLGAEKVDIITNGYDEADFKNINEELSDAFTITHIGSMNKDRNPVVLWEVMAELCTELGGFKDALTIQLIGKTDFAIFEALEKCGLQDAVEKVGYMQHGQVVQEMAKSQVLLLPINDTPNVAGVVPGKIFEYMAVKRPILCIGPPEADSGRIIAEAKAGVVAGFEDRDTMKKALIDMYQRYKQKDLTLNSSDQITKYSRRLKAGEFCDILNELV